MAAKLIPAHFNFQFQSTLFFLFHLESMALFLDKSAKRFLELAHGARTTMRGIFFQILIKITLN
jgi:hypothetical protein